jgi:hypothetical protein
MSPSLVIADLIDLFIEAALYGLYVATVIHCLRWLLYADDSWKLRDGVNKLMLITTILIFLLITVNIFLELQRHLFYTGNSNLWSVAEEVITVCKYHGWHLEPKKLISNFLFPRF